MVYTTNTIKIRTLRGEDSSVGREAEEDEAEALALLRGGMHVAKVVVDRAPS
jgi:hypothetical protein